MTTKKEPEPLTKEIENFPRDTMKAAVKVKDGVHMRGQKLVPASWTAPLR
jgi:hypothetical protein